MQEISHSFGQPLSIRSRIVRLVACFLTSFAVTAAAADGSQVKLGGPTPHQVLDGTARLVGAIDPGQKLRLVFGIVPPHVDEEKKFLEELGKKDSPRYQHFLKPEEWNKRFAPSKLDEQAVVDWAKSQGFTITHRWPNRLTVDVEAPVAIIENALNVKINKYAIGATAYFSNDRDPQIPASLTEVIHSVQGLNNIRQLRPTIKGEATQKFDQLYSPGPLVSVQSPLVHAGNSKGLPAAGAHPGKKSFRKGITNGYYDPSDLYNSNGYDFQALYDQGHCCNPYGYPNGSPAESSIAIATAGSYASSDIIGFLNQYNLAGDITPIWVGGTPACCNNETTLDVEWSTAMSNSFGSYLDTAQIFTYEGTDGGLGTFTSIFQQILNDSNARVMTTSWGCAEFVCYDTGTMDTDDWIFSQMIGQGWTLLAASDDNGATASYVQNNVQYCVTSDSVEFPASDPNVVAAGGTTLYTSSGGFSSETGWQGGTWTGACASNNGGSGGGFSAYYAAPSYQQPLGFNNRAVPDIALNASVGENYFFAGQLSPTGGTSIVAPELAGFFAQENSYMDYVAAINGGCYGTGQCAPIGNGNWYIYYFGENPYYAPHYPFYDITSGCNSNDITAAYNLGYYCAGTGYDLVTGWGSANMLQLAWAINTYRAGDFGAPVANFSGPATYTWYNTDQTVSWTVSDTSNNGNPVGVAGFNQAWDADPGDVFSQPTPGSGNTFYSGPQFPNATSGCLDLAGTNGCSGGSGQGWHTVHIRAWDNTGFPSGDMTYGPIGYDTVAPVTSASLKGTLVNGIFQSAVTVTLTATDAQPGSGVAYTVYQVNGGSQVTYTGPFQVSSTGANSVEFHSVDNAGNVEQNEFSNFQIEAPTSTGLASSVNPSSYGQSVTFTATVKASFGGVPNGSVQFKDGNSVIGTAGLNGSGVAQLSTAALSVGVHSMTAVYLGNSHFVGSTSSSLKQTVNKAKTTTSLVSSQNPSIKGKPVTFTATVHPAFGGAPSGKVTFKDGVTVLGSVVVNATTHTAKFTTGKLSVGTHHITANYGGDTNFLSSASVVLKQVVKP
jgi:hypothetical protein